MKLPFHAGSFGSRRTGSQVWIGVLAAGHGSPLGATSPSRRPVLASFRPSGSGGFRCEVCARTAEKSTSTTGPRRPRSSYCQKCRKPFGAASLINEGSAAATRARERGFGVPHPCLVPNTPATPARVAAPPAQKSSRRPNRSEDSKPPPEDTRPPIQPERPVAAKVIVPKLLSKAKSDALDTHKARLLYLSPDGLETEFELEEISSIGRHPRNTIRLPRPRGLQGARGHRKAQRALFSSGSELLQRKLRQQPTDFARRSSKRAMSCCSARCV